jgi:serine-type D-Ala-D-Ala carboxypeptidase (penicillin-binding protein 5/6)
MRFLRGFSPVAAKVKGAITYRMNPHRYLIEIVAAALFLSGLTAMPAHAAISPFANSATSYLVQVNGSTFREKNPNLRRPPASLTKIMTALIVMERCDPHQVVTVSQGAALETGSRIGLRLGQKFRVRDLLAATLMASANDACRALADYVGGNQKGFVALMNAKARELKLVNTRFTNACGHDHARLYSSAHDLAILSQEALRNPLFTDIVGRRTMKISTLKGNRTFSFKNKNRLIGKYPGARGVKTGTTPGAGQCLVAFAERGDRKVLLVIMHAKNRWRSAPAMLDAAFAANSSAFRKVDGGEHETLPQGAVVRN